MTSKEALEEWYGTISVNDKIRWEDNYLSIKKDLEVLEIVKTHKLLNYVIKNEKCAKMYNLTEKEINKLKEWCENE